MAKWPLTCSKNRTFNLYWNIGEYITKKIEPAERGDSVVSELAKHIQKNEPEIKGFSDKNLWRMK